MAQAGGAVLDMSLNPATPSMTTTANAPASKPSGGSGSSATAKAAKKTSPCMGDSFESSLGYAGRGTESVCPLDAVPCEDEAALQCVRLMKNLLFAPTHKSYEKMPETKAHAPVVGEHGADLYSKGIILPVVLRDNTKFARPALAVLTYDAVSSSFPVNLTYVVFGNSGIDDRQAPVQEILYNLDKNHGVALSCNLKVFTPVKALWCKLNLIDHQVKYMLACIKKKHPLWKVFSGTSDERDVLARVLSREGKGIQLLVVDGLRSEKAELRGAYNLDTYGGDSTNVKATLDLLGEYQTACNDDYVTSKFFTLFKKLATLTYVPALPPSAAEPGNKRVRTLDDSEEEASPAPAPAKKQKESKHSKESKESKKKDDESEDDDEMSGSGSDSGSESEDSEEEEEEEDDSEEEEDSEDEDEPKKTKVASKPAFVKPKPSATPGGTAVSAVAPSPADPMRPQIRQNEKQAKSKPEKEKRKPAKSRRQGVSTLVRGVLDQLTALDDAVPHAHQDRLTTKVEKVRETLREYVNEGKVPHVQELITSQTQLISELGTLIAKIGASEGPRGPDSAASRKMALAMGRLYQQESPEFEDLATDLTRWASKMSEMICRRAKASLEAEQAASQLRA